MLSRKMSADEKAEVRSRTENMEEYRVAGLNDWAAVRVHLKRHDDEMVKDYEDDINTMLVFAGLFSAVVTTFIVWSLTWLQQDNTQVSAQLLAQISLQMDGAPVNRTLVSMGQGTYPFNPGATSIWVNTLWALSLLFSLAAALAGIIIKQWLREYLLWDSVLFHPREAVLLRHIRFEAWEQWRVPEIISAIPALLEIALLLFLCGAVILLWNLNISVAIVVTFFGAIFFVFACAVNVLPIVFHRCPYKSAVGWTCVSAWSLVRRWVFAMRKQIRRFLSANQQHQTRELRLSSLHARTTSWRQRDLQRHRQWGMQVNWDVLPEMERQPRLETVELVILYHALAWVCTRTQDDRLLDKVQQCTRNFYGNNRKHLCLNAGVYTASQLMMLDASLFFKSLREDLTQEQVDGSEYGLYSLSTVIYSRTGEAAFWQNKFRDEQSFVMVCNVLLNVAQAFIPELLPEGPNVRRPEVKEVNAFMEALCFLSHVVQSSAPEWRPQFVGVLVELYSKLAAAEVPGPWITQGALVPRYLGLKAVVVQLLTRASVVELRPDGELIATPLDDLSQTDFPRLAIQIFRNNPSYARKEDQHLFITVANIALRRSIHGADITGDIASLQELLTCIEQAAWTSSKRQIPNLGSFSPKPLLLETILWFAKQRATVSIHLISATLVEIFKDSLDASLLAEPSRTLVEQLTRLIHKRGSTHIRWESDETAVTCLTDELDLESGLAASAVNGFHRHSIPERDTLNEERPGPRMPIPSIPQATYSVVTDSDRDVELVPLGCPYPSPLSDPNTSPTWSK